jgi:hypothetical protein
VGKATAQGTTDAPFKAVDDHALQATAADERDLTALSRYLAKGCKNEKDRARAIYRWITDRIAYDDSWLRGESKLVQDPLAVLAKRKTDCVGSARLFLDLATRLNVKAVMIDGRFKPPPTSQPGQKVPTSHTWNGVRLGGKWSIVDPSGHFFLVEPEKWILVYFPKSPDLQFLRKPVSAQEFERWPRVNPDFVRLEVPAKRMREALAQNAEMVKVLHATADLAHVIEAPLGRFLEAGRQYDFTVRSTDADQIVVRFADGTQQLLERDGAVFSGAITPKEGTVLVGAAITAAGTIHVILEYQCGPLRGISRNAGQGSSPNHSSARTSRPLRV